MASKSGNKAAENNRAPLKADRRPTYERLCEVLEFHPETATFTWKKHSQARFIGKPAGANNRGYTQICIDYVTYKAHQLVWLYVHKRWPVSFLDHINGNPGDNRPENLREVTFIQNSQNKKIMANNKSGYKGVSFSHARNQYEAAIKVGGKKKFLGRFDDPVTAHEAYTAAAKQYFGEYARLA